MLTKTRQTLAAEYGICRKTLRKQMDAMPYKFPNLLTGQWVKLIYEELGYPEGVNDSDFETIKVPRPYRDLFKY